MEEAGEKPVVGTVTAHAGSKLVVARDIGSLIFQSSPEPPAPPVVYLPQRPPLVIGREAEIEALRNRLKEPGSATFVSGLAGRGKTTLALEYAHRYQYDFESVHWLPCQGRSLIQMTGELAWQLGLKLDGELDGILRQVNDHCARTRCLLLLDNVEDEVPAKLMPGGRSSVLVTTRFNNLRFLRLNQPLNLPLFTEEQCFELFGKVFGKEEVGRHQAEARSLFHRLGYLPIGIAVAASLIREDVRYTIAGMAKKLPSDAYALLKEAVAALSPGAQTLLACMAACAQEGFRLALAAEVAGLDETSSLDALQEIHSRSLVDELDRTTRRYRIHALVREAAGVSDLQRRNHVECVLKEFQKWENGWRECEEDMADWRAAFSCLLGHAEDGESWMKITDLGYKGCSLTYQLGRLMEAHEIAERVAQEANRRKDRGTLQAWYGNQALVVQTWGRLDEAMALLKKQESICMEVDRRDCLPDSYGNQALILKIWGRLDEAMALLKKQESICLELGDRDGLEISYGNQALILQDWGRLDEAMELHKKSEAICRELDKKNGLQASYGNQALILKAWGYLDEAMALHTKEEAICRELGHQDGLQRSYGNQALILLEWKRLEEAMALLKKQETICLELRNQYSLQRSYGDQASILLEWKRLEEARALLTKQEIICLELGHREGLASCYWGWGLLAREQGDSKTAREKLDQALAIFAELQMPCEIGALQDLLNEGNGHTPSI